MSLSRMLMTLLFIGAGIALLQALVMPAWAEVNALRAEVVQVTEAISQTNEVIRLRDDLEKRYQTVSPDQIERIRSFLPSKSEVGDLLIDIDMLSAKAGVKLVNITFIETPSQAAEAEVALTGVQEVLLNFAVSGPYSNIRDFLVSVERNLRIVDVVSIAFSGAEKDDFTFTIQAKAYYQEGGIL